MSSERHVLALDQGTTSSRAILFDQSGNPRATGQRELTQIYPAPGWVEHDPEEIWFTELAVVHDALVRARVSPSQIAAVGITNQRETVILWDRNTGRPIRNAIVWQCRRTADLCDALRQQGYERLIHAKTGLMLDPYFSASKIAWTLDQTPRLRERAEKGHIAFGTVDSWLVYKLTGGRLHITDVSNASRTMLFDISRLRWDDELLDLFRIPRSLCPEVRASSGTVGLTDPSLFGAEVPIAGMAGDQQAALFGHGCIEPGMAKNTYGTGSFLLMNTGFEPVSSQNGLISTVAWQVGDTVQYALEGSVFTTGAVVQWLRDELKIIGRAEETEALAQSVDDTGGVYFVPAFAGLGAPHWDSQARGAILGLTRSTNRAHLVRAGLESIAYMTRDVLEAMSRDSGRPLDALRSDGGAIKNNFLAQFQADILGIPVERPRITESTALGAAFLAGLGTGFWPSLDALQEVRGVERTFEPALDPETRQQLYGGWQKAVGRITG